MPAAIVGDIAPGDGVSKEEKCRRETAAIEEIRSLIGPDTDPGKCSLCLQLQLVHSKVSCSSNGCQANIDNISQITSDMFHSLPSSSGSFLHCL